MSEKRPDTAPPSPSSEERSRQGQSVPASQDSSEQRRRPRGKKRSPGRERGNEPKKKTGPAKPSPFSRAITEILGADGTLHPALLPGIGVSDTDKRFGVDWWVFGIAGAFIIFFVGFGLLSPETLGSAASAGVSWVTLNTGWLFSGLTIVVFIYMLVVGFTSKGRIRLGRDDEKPEFSTFSWVAMMFSAGMGIGLLFFGPYEPLTFFLDQAPAFDVEPGSIEAMRAALAQTLLHWGPLAWSYYALVGGAIAYSTFRRGRSSTISAIFDPIFHERLKIPLGRIIDIFAILVTLFGTAISLGIGAMQIGRGIEVVGGIGEIGNGVIISLMVVLTIAFIFSAVSGVKRGIRALSNINMFLALGLGLFVFIAGPTVFLLDFIPSGLLSFFHNLGPMLGVFPSSSPETAAWMEGWTTYYWAWWVSWTPFVGMFIAKISRGRTIREFVVVVIIVPSIVCLLWFGTMGGTSMWMESQGLGISEAEQSQDILFAMIQNLPFATVLSLIVMLSLTIFFITSADSASVVMASTSQKGKPTPSRKITALWGIALAATGITLLLAGGEDALSALQALVTISALPFAVVLVFLMVAWWKDLSTDPLMLRREYAEVAIDEGIRRGIRQFGDDFVFSAGVVSAEQGAGAWLDSGDASLTDWYEEALKAELTAEAEAEAKAESDEESVTDHFATDKSGETPSEPETEVSSD